MSMNRYHSSGTNMAYLFTLSRALLRPDNICLSISGQIVDRIWWSRFCNWEFPSNWGSFSSSLARNCLLTFTSQNMQKIIYQASGRITQSFQLTAYCFVWVCVFLQPNIWIVRNYSSTKDKIKHRLLQMCKYHDIGPHAERVWLLSKAFVLCELFNFIYWWSLIISKKWWAS